MACKTELRCSANFVLILGLPQAVKLSKVTDAFAGGVVCLVGG